MPFIIHEGASIHWQRHGAVGAPPLVMLHSIGTDLDIFAEAVPLLESRFDIVLVDLRGHGASQASQGEYSLALLARDVLAAMDAAGIEAAIVCGVSLGGMVAMELARLATGRFAGLVLANTSAAMDPSLWPERIATTRDRGLAAIAQGWAARHLSADYMAANPDRVARLEQRFLATEPIGYIGCAAAIRDMELLPALSALQVPVLVIGGEHDVATPFAGHGERIASAIAGAEVAMLPAGHLACLEHPELFAAGITTFAARCR